MPRILAPKVHVEVFRPTHISPVSDTTGRKTTMRPNPTTLPNRILYKRIVDIDDKRIKGIQFEETALFGGFIEINIAEDPQSELFDNFSPNDHVEVFYDDVKETDTSFVDMEKVLPLFSIKDKYDITNRKPKFQGATWKTDLLYKKSYITTKLFAWDYLRILQYINIPRGERKGERSTTIKTIHELEGVRSAGLSIKKSRQKFGDDMLDFIDGAYSTFVECRDHISIFGQSLVNKELKIDGVTKEGLSFSSTSNKDKYKPAVSLYTAGIGPHCKLKIEKDKSGYGKFPEVKVPNPSTASSFASMIGSRTTQVKWSEANYHDLENAEETADAVSKAIDNMSKYDMLQFRFIDGVFERFQGFATSTETVDNSFSFGTHYVADIIVITQFALIELLLKKLTSTHGLNQWFTPIIKLDPDFQNEIEELGKVVGKGISKLIYIRLRQVSIVEDKTVEKTLVAFNIDTYPYVAKFATDALKLVAGNLLSSVYGKNISQSEISVDIFSEILASIDFPQPISDNNITMKPLVTANVGDAKEDQEALFKSFMELFTSNFIASDEVNETFAPEFYNDIAKRVNTYATFIQKVLSKDDKIISYIKGVPASYMRADIYSGSKFNTIQYDSLAITRMIQLIVSNMAGFPATNNPISNTEKGKIDSYPIFAANRIVIKPKAYFGVKVPDVKINNIITYHTYDLYPSLSELVAKSGNKKEAYATCFLILEVAKKKLKGTNEAPEFEFPMEDIQDFGMIKASTVNHFFNFSIADQFQSMDFFTGVHEEEEYRSVYKNVSENGIFIEYREGGMNFAGFTPPEHQHLKLVDLTQQTSYNSWSPRFVGNTNINSDIHSDKPIFNPKTAYLNRLPKGDAKEGYYIINNYDTYGEVLVRKATSETSDQLYIPGVPIKKPEFHTLPFHGITGYVDISDLKAEYRTLKLILTSDATYRDISNVDLELMKNIYIRAPLKFIIIPKQRIVKYKDRIKFSRPSSGSKTYVEKSLHEIILEINEELDKIDEIDMMWLFPYSGHKILDNGDMAAPELDQMFGSVDEVWRKNLFLVMYLDLLVKGIRYLLWSLAKARFFAHVYLPIEYAKYAKKIPVPKPGDPKFVFSAIVEPGASVKITVDDSNSLYKSTDVPLVAFPIKGLNKNQFVPLVRSLSRGTRTVRVPRPRRGDDLGVGPFYLKPNEIASEEIREMTWYVSKKVTYIGADVGAMMRVEMTEGSLDWTLFYNEKNLLTQVSEHYLLNGLGNFRAGGKF